MKKVLAFFLCSLFLIAASKAVEYKLGFQSKKYSEADLDQLFQNHCGDAKRISPEIPYPNYKSQLVRKAATKLNTVAPVSFYMYGAVISSYGFRKGKRDDFPWHTYEDILSLPQNLQFGEKKNWDTGERTFDGEYLKRKFDYEYFSKDSRPPNAFFVDGKKVQVNGNTHAFLTYLCGEFRDRPTLIEEKLKWLTNMIKLPVRPQQKIDPAKLSSSGGSVWSQVTAESYAHYVTFSRHAFQAKETKAWGEQHETRRMDLSETWKVDRPVPAFTVCEVKYMFTEYISQPDQQSKEFPGYEKYMDGLARYQAQYCSVADIDHYYDFRGDSNMKPNSPESNAMIWHATSIMGRCQRDSKGNVSVAKDRTTGKELDFNVNACIKYMSRPFANRWNAARAGLVTWTLRHEKYDDEFSDTGSLVSIVPNLNPEYRPANFKFYGEEILRGDDPTNFMDLYSANTALLWNSPDSGFSAVFGITGSEVVEIDYAYERIKDAVDRHTDWYASGYDDSNLEPTRAREIGQAYSPFVASSYEMSESDAFTAPGITINGPFDGRRQWMFVFKVHKSKWYNTESLKDGLPINFETQWFDETSFGTTHLADTERAWDRLGTPLEGEMESILYLHNIMNDGNAIKHLSSPDEFPAVAEDNLGSTQTQGGN